MIDWIKNWVISICSAVIFISAVELIIPDNKMDRYVKFVMGLILIAIIMNPIVKVLSHKLDMATYINKANNYMDSKSLDDSVKKYKQQDEINTLNTFKTNIENTSTKMLKDKFPNNEYVIKADVSYSNEGRDVVINDLKIDVKNQGIDKIQKVDINTKTVGADTASQSSDKMAIEIKNYLNQELKIDEKNIYVNEDKE